MPWRPIPGVPELVNLRDALTQPIDARLAYLRSRFVGGPVAAEASLETALLVHELRAELFDGLAWDLKAKTVRMLSDDHRPGI
jgi:hypothetical protein